MTNIGQNADMGYALNKTRMDTYILPHTNIFHRQTKDKGCHKAWQPIFMSRDLCHVIRCSRTRTRSRSDR